MQGSGYRAHDLQRMLAEAGVMDNITFRFTSIARHLADLQQDPMCTSAQTQLKAWILNFNQQNVQHGASAHGNANFNFEELREALTKAR